MDSTSQTARLIAARSRETARCRDAPAFRPPDSGRRFRLQSRTTHALTSRGESRDPAWPRGCLHAGGRLTGACPDGGGAPRRTPEFTPARRFRQMAQSSATTQSGPQTSAGAWGLRYPGLVMRQRRQERGQGVHRHVAPQARRRPGGVHEDAGPGRLDHPPGAIVLGADHEARADPHGALVRRQDAGVRRLHPVLHLAVRRHPGEVLRRLRAQREGEPAGDLGPVRRLPDRPGRDGARRRRVHRTRPDQDPGLLRRRSEPQHRPDLQGGRLVREDAEVPACGRQRRRQPRGQGQRVPEGAGQAVRARAERRRRSTRTSAASGSTRTSPNASKGSSPRRA